MRTVDLAGLSSIQYFNIQYLSVPHKIIQNTHTKYSHFIYKKLLLKIDPQFAKIDHTIQ